MSPQAESPREAALSEGDRHVSLDASQFSAAASARHISHKQQLGLAGLVCLIFLEVSGGPFGTEDAVKAAGPRLAILGFLFLPFIWSVPEALICAELATAFPENSGYVVWVETAFGPFFGFLEGLFSWVSGVTDNTVYPIMLISYVELFVPALSSSWWLNKLTLMGTSILMTALNYSGLDIVGKASEVITLTVVAPFIILAIMAIPTMKISNWRNTKPLAKVDWLSYLNIMFWNLNSWDSISTLAGEVRNPSKIFPRALLLAVQLVIAMYLFPLLIGVAVTDNVYGDWTLGYYGHVAELVGGPALAAAVTVAAALSQVGMFEAEMSADSYQVLGMAERGYLPRSFARRSIFGTPEIGILLSSLGIFMMLLFDFMQILEMLNAIYCLAELLEFAAFIWLRISQPNLRRSYKVPLPVWALCLMLLPASGLLVTLILLHVVMRQWHVVLYTVAVLLLGISLYAGLQMLRRAGTVQFEYSESLSRDRWRPGTLSMALAALPTFLVGVVLESVLHLSGLPLVLCTAAAGVGIISVVLLLIPRMLKREGDWHYGPYAALNGATASGVPGAHAGGLSRGVSAAWPGTLQSIPETDAAQAPLMRAFLQDSLVSVSGEKGLLDQPADQSNGCDDDCVGVDADVESANDSVVPE